MSRYIDADKLIVEIERREKIIRNSVNQISDSEKKTYYSGCADALLELLPLMSFLRQEPPEVDYNIIPLPEERMASYIAYCLGREDDDCNCPTCGKHVTGLRLFPYYYDRENNDVYFASVCPECGKIIISKE